MRITLLLALSCAVPAAAKDAGSLYALKVRSIEGKGVALSDYKGKVALVVNTASKCGYTPQYKALQLASKVAPDDPQVTAKIEELLKAKS